MTGRDHLPERKMSETPDQPDPKEAAEARLCAYLEGELADADRAEVDRHLAANPVHRQLLADLARQRAWLRAVSPERAPAEVADVYQQQVERSMLMGDDRRPVAAPGQFRRYLPLAAMLVVTLGLVGVLAFILLPPPRRSTGPVALNGTALPPTTVPATAPAALAEAGRPLNPVGEEVDNAANNPNDVLGGVAQQGQQTSAGPPATQRLATPAMVSANVLTVTADDPTAVDRRIREFVAADHVRLADAPSTVGPRPPQTTPRSARVAGPAKSTTAPVVPLRYVVTGLSAEQAGQLSAAVSAAAGPPLRPGQMVTLRIAQLAGKAGLSADNTVRVSDAGTVALPMIDPVPAAGLTPAELAARVADAYRQANVMPAATVTVMALQPPGPATSAVKQLGGIGGTLTIEVRSKP